jgi:hypothetical protein
MGHILNNIDIRMMLRLFGEYEHSNTASANRNREKGTASIWEVEGGEGSVRRRGGEKRETSS